MRVQPIRTCAGCARRAGQRTLLRFVAGGDGLRPDGARRAPGRGAYLHDDRGCWDLFVRRRGPLRSLRRTVGRTERERLVSAFAMRKR